MLDLYVRADTRVHRLPAGAKLLALAAAGAGALWLNDPAALAAAVLAALALFRLAEVPMAALWRSLRPTLLPLALVLGAQSIVAGPDAGLVMVLRLGVLILLATLITATTRVADMVETVEAACRPLARFGVKPRKVGLVLAMALRFVPLIADRLRAIQDAQRARGIDRSPVVLLVPLFVSVLHLAHELAEALDARRFDGE